MRQHLIYNESTESILTKLQILQGHGTMYISDKREQPERGTGPRSIGE